MRISLRSKFLLSLLMGLSMFIAYSQQNSVQSDNAEIRSGEFSMEQKLELFIVKKNLPHAVDNTTNTIFFQNGDKLIFDFIENTVDGNGLSYLLKEIVYTPIKCMIYLKTNSDRQNSQDPEEIILSKSKVVLKYSDNHRIKYKYETISSLK